MNCNDGIRALDGFFLGAALQSDPFLEGFGDVPDEPPDDYSPPQRVVQRKEPEPEPDLFSCLDEPSPPPPPAAEHPQIDKKPPQLQPQQVQVQEQVVHRPPPPSSTSYQNLLKVFCGSTALATYWYNKIHNIDK